MDLKELEEQPEVVRERIHHQVERLRGQVRELKDYLERTECAGAERFRRNRQRGRPEAMDG